MSHGRLAPLLLVVAVWPQVLISQDRTPVTVTLAATPNPSTFGAPVTLTAFISPPAATGRVTFYDGTTVLGSRPVTPGVAVLSTILLPAGTRKLTAYYSGDANFAPARGAASQTVNAVAAVGFRATGGVATAALAGSVPVVADFNGDGKADFAVGSKSVDVGISVFLGKGDGTFQAAQNFAIGYSAMNLAVADFNNDGKADIVAAGSDPAGAKVMNYLPGNGDGSFGIPVSLPAAAQILVADFNRDGNADLATITAEGQSAVLLGRGDGTFQPAIPVAGTALDLAFATGDFNDDGIPDLVFLPGNFIEFSKGLGDGTFAPPVKIPGYADTFRSMTVADFDRDGRSDIVLGGNFSLQVFLKGNGDGGFPGPVSYPLIGFSTAGDFNGDGIPDLAVAHPSTTAGGTDEIDLLQGNGDGTFQLVLHYPTTSLAAGLVVADFNGDGRADLVSNASLNGNPDGNSVNVFLGVTAGLTLNATLGASQSGLLNTAFGFPLRATLVQDGKPVSGATVTFSAPVSGPGATLGSLTAVTNAAGIASVTATANGIAGPYVVTAAYQGLTASFTLTNATVAGITAVDGSAQSALLGLPFSKQLQVKVTDSVGNPAVGAVVAFTAPSNGAGASLPNSATTDLFGIAKVTVQATGFAGTYSVVASAGGFSTSFTLTNTKIASIIAISGAGQSTPLGTRFTNPLSALVRDSSGAPVTDYPVTFSGPSSGAGLVVYITTNTDRSGVASMTASPNNIVGSYVVIATVSGPETPPLSASFALSNFSPAGTQNLAYRRTATQSSTSTVNANAAASSAVDGIRDGDFAHGSVTLTNLDVFPWWQVDLGSSAAIDYIVVWNRTDCCDTMASTYLMISDTPFSPSDNPFNVQGRPGVYITQQGAFSGFTSHTTVTDGAHGRYVRLQSGFSGATLSFAELEVFGNFATHVPDVKSGVHRNGSWFVDFNGNQQWDATDAAHIFSFGLAGDIPVVGDWNGDGRPKAGIFRNGLWFVDWNGNQQWDATDAAHILSFGLPGDVPVMGDWNGDGRLKMGVFRNGQWFVDWNGNQQWDAIDTAHIISFGLAGDLPVMGDWNGDGHLKVGVFRNGLWFVDYNGNQQWDATDSTHVFSFGLPGDLPVVGDWNGDGHLKPGVFRNGIWLVDWNGNQKWDETDLAHVFNFGLAGDIPVMGAWN